MLNRIGVHVALGSVALTVGVTCGLACGGGGATAENGDGDGDGEGEGEGEGEGDGDGDGDGDDGAHPLDTPSPSDPSCADHAQRNGWHAFVCDNGDGACVNEGETTVDCSLCCAGPSCGELAASLDWGDTAACEANGNGACNGEGTPTWDCELCCGDAQGTGGFGYPVGDFETSPAGGWTVWQVMGHYWDAYGGRHLAQDVAHQDGGIATVDQPIHSIADGTVRYAGPNGSSYVNVVLIEHEYGNGERICSFFGHVTTPLVSTGDFVARGEQVSSVLDWALAVNNGSSANTHLHYVLLSGDLCDASANANGALVCGYDTGGPNAIETLDDEPYTYTSVADVCGDWQYEDAFISPSRFIDEHAG